MSQFTLVVPDMQCPACEYVVEDEVGSKKAVERIIADYSAGEILIEGGDGIRQQVVQAVESAGYTVENPKAKSN